MRDDRHLSSLFSAFRLFLRDTIVAFLRPFPRLPGRKLLGGLVVRMLSSYDRPEEYMATVPMRHGGKIRIDLRSDTAAWAYWTGRYDEAVIRELLRLLPRDGMVLDIGAHVGFYAVALGRYLKEGGGTLYAVEPVPGNFETLCENVDLNALGDVVRPLNVALGDREGEIPIHFLDEDRAHVGNAVVATGRVSEILPSNLRASMTTLDTLARTHAIESCALIKMDIEGYEYRCLKDGMDFIRATMPAIYGEFSNYWMGMQGDSLEDVCDLLFPLGYEAFVQTSRGRFVRTDNPGKHSENVLFLPPELDIAKRTANPEHRAY